MIDDNQVSEIPFVRVRGFRSRGDVPTLAAMTRGNLKIEKLGWTLHEPTSLLFQRDRAPGRLKASLK